MSAWRPAVFAALVLGALLACACKGDGAAPKPDPNAPPPDFTLPALDFDAIAAERRTREASEAQLQRGAQCGWREGWMTTVRAARQDEPAAFRSRTVGRAFGWGALALLLGLGGTLLLAFLLPRMRRRARPVATAAPAAGANPATESWGAWSRGLLVRALKQLGRAMRFEQFDPLLANERLRMLETCREAERQLSVALALVSLVPRPAATPAAAADSGEAGPAAPPPREAVVEKGLETWRAEIANLRRRLEGPARLSPQLAPDRVAPRLAAVVRAARDTRLGAERTVIAEGRGERLCDALERALGERPETPRDRATGVDVELAPWVRTIGWAGLGALVLALPMLACWMAAGAFPLFFALLFGLGGLGAILFARAHLHRAGNLPLVPGFADRVARWLTVVLAVALAVTLGSSWMSADGGLDMGDPPPVAMPDPSLLRAPELFPAAAAKTQSGTLAPPLPAPPPSEGPPP